MISTRIKILSVVALKNSVKLDTRVQTYGNENMPIPSSHSTFPFENCTYNENLISPFENAAHMNVNFYVECTLH